MQMTDILYLSVNLNDIKRSLTKRGKPRMAQAVDSIGNVYSSQACTLRGQNGFAAAGTGTVPAKSLPE